MIRVQEQIGEIKTKLKIKLKIKKKLNPVERNCKENGQKEVFKFDKSSLSMREIT